MNRVIKFDVGIVDSLNPRKYILKEEYEGFGIYQEMCPSGFYHHQSWLVANDKVNLICESYNNYCKEELLDMIDNYNKNTRFGVKGSCIAIINKVVIYRAHHNHKDFI